MSIIAELQFQLAAAENAELASLELDGLREHIDAIDRRAEKLARQLAEVRAERLALAADRDERIRRGARAGLTASKLAEAAGLTRSRTAQIIAEEPEASAAAETGGSTATTCTP